VNRILTMRRLGLALAVLAIALPGWAQNADMSLLHYSGRDRMERIIAAAKKEGTVAIYESTNAKDFSRFVKPFEEKYGIKVSTWRAGCVNLLQRTVAEARGNTYKADLINSCPTQMEALSREKILQPVDSPTFKDLIPGAVPKHHEWATVLLTPFVMAYNTNLVKKEDLPKTYRDLLDPKWKGKLGIEATDYDWLAIVTAQLGGEPGVQLFRDIVARNGIMVRQGHSLLGNLVAAGDIPLALTVYQYNAVQLKRGGASVDWFTLDPAVTYSSAIGITRHAVHPNAALLFYEFMIGDTQNPVADMDYLPSNTRVDSRLKNTKINLIDAGVAIDEQDKRLDLFMDLMVRRK